MGGDLISSAALILEGGQSASPMTKHVQQRTDVLRITCHHYDIYSRASPSPHPGLTISFAACLRDTGP